jgi:hypothetical protein
MRQHRSSNFIMSLSYRWLFSHLSPVKSFWAGIKSQFLGIVTAVMTRYPCLISVWRVEG